jgi:hypothetical protein
MRALQLCRVPRQRSRRPDPPAGPCPCSTLPTQLSQLQALRHLVLSHNWLQALRGPGGEGGFEALCQLRGLASLALANVSDKRHSQQVRALGPGGRGLTR